jgi:hypothetical protein
MGSPGALWSTSTRPNPSPLMRRVGAFCEGNSAVPDRVERFSVVCDGQYPPQIRARRRHADSLKVDGMRPVVRTLPVDRSAT